jgi:S1-C subfamily serine protease
MALVVEIVSGARAGARQTFGKSVVIAGRHPTSDLLFDANKDLDVSTRHAEFRGSATGWSVHDLGSTNGTFVNGRRITTPANVANGDTVAFGESGPRVKIVSTTGVNEAAPPRTEQRASAGVTRPKTEERIAAAVAHQTSGLKRFVVSLAVLVVFGVGALVWLNQQQAKRSQRVIDQLLARQDSLTSALQVALAAASKQATGFDSLQRIWSDERARLRAQLQAGGDVTAITGQLNALERRGDQAVALSNAQISSENNKAVVLILVEDEDGKRSAGTAFSVTPDGLLVTNRHIALDASGRPPRKAGVYFADTDAFKEVRFVSASSDPAVDVAFFQLVDPGPWPTVKGVANTAQLAPGDPVMMIGFPNTNSDGKKRTTLTVGAISNVLDNGTIRMNLFAAEGSSGSPVFDARGYVIGVLYAGEGGVSSSVTHAIPAAALIKLLPSNARGIVRQ